MAALYIIMNGMNWHVLADGAVEVTKLGLGLGWDRRLKSLTIDRKCEAHQFSILILGHDGANALVLRDLHYHGWFRDAFGDPMPNRVSATFTPVIDHACRSSRVPSSTH